MGAPACEEPGQGWCLARRIAGDVPEGELGFRFGEPLDLDGDGRADFAAGTRFKRQGVFQTGMAGAWSGATGTRMFVWEGEIENGLFGHWVLPVPDLGGDGLADLIVAAPNAAIDGDVRGVLVARSPKTDAVLWRHAGSRNENLGWDLAAAGDHDGDGRADLFAGAPAADTGQAYLLSGRDGATLRTYTPPRPLPNFGWCVTRLDDLDGDGRPDLAVGAPDEKDAAGAVAGAAYALSSASGAMLRHWTGGSALAGMGEVVAGIGDLDGDRRGEVAVASPRTIDQSRTLPGEVHVFSSASGKLLWHWTGTQPGELFGRMVIGAGDVDGDGVEDIAIGAPWHRRGTNVRAGRLEIRSGRSGAVLSELFGDTADAWFGWHIRRAPDPDGRGRPALMISSLRHPVDGVAGVGVLDLYVLRRDQP